TYTECQWSCAETGCKGLAGSPGSGSNWASGGGYGEPFATFCPPMTPNDGGGAVTANNADCGTGGTASTNLVGAFSGTTWSPSKGGSGKAGGDGGGGGGCGGGGSYCGGACFG